MYPFRVTHRPGDGTVPRYPQECEPHTGPEDWDQEFLARVIPTMDQRQCRGCGLWAIWTPRAITANLKPGARHYGSSCEQGAAMEVIRDDERNFPTRLNGEDVPTNSRVYRGVWCPTCHAIPGVWCRRVVASGERTMLRALHKSREQRLAAIDAQGWRNPQGGRD